MYRRGRVEHVRSLESPGGPPANSWLGGRLSHGAGKPLARRDAPPWRSGPVALPVGRGSDDDHPSAQP
jgi:hypothetical protein